MKRLSFLSTLATLFLVAIMLSGCGGSNFDDRGGGGDLGGPVVGPGTGTISLRHAELLRAVPQEVSSFRLTGLNVDSEVIYGPRVEPKAPVVIFEAVPLNVTEIVIEYLQNGEARFLYRAPVIIPADGVLNIVDPEFQDLRTLERLEVEPRQTAIPRGTTQQFHVTGIFSDAGREDFSGVVTWSTSNSQVASIDQNGLASGLEVGTTEITASLNGFEATATFEVTDAVLISLGVTPTTPSIPDGLTQQFTATGTFSDSSTMDLTDSVTWSSDTTTAATISNAAGTEGLATAVDPGTTTITADAGSGITDSTTLTVTAAVLDSIAVTPTNPSIPDGRTQQFTATGTFSDSSTMDLTDSVTWSSDTTATATISNATGTEGLATAVDPGTTTITADAGSGITDSTTLTVTAAVLDSIAVTPTNPSIPDGRTQQFTATGTFSDSSTMDLTDSVTWSSNTNATATISNAAGTEGLATAVDPGTTTITADAGSGITDSTTLTVTAAVLESINVTPTNPSIPDGRTRQFTATGTFSDSSTMDLTDSVTWSSNTKATATISNAAGTEGLATAVDPGTTTITADAGSGITDSTTLTVTAAVLDSIAVTPTNPSIPDGRTQQFTATGTFSDSSTMDLTDSVTWSSNTNATATISNATGTEGLATAVDPGTTTITADAGSGITDSTTLTVTAAVLESINVTPTNPSIPDGRTRQFTATGTFSDSSTMNLTNSVTWSSGTTATATISNAAGTKGLATAVNPGTTTITADAGGGITDDATLTVTAAVLDSIEVTPISPFIQIGQTQQFTATGTFSDSSTMDLTDSVTWSSDTTATATISNAAGSEGLATSVATGTTTITADAGGGKTDNTTLTVTEQLKYLYVLNEFFNDISIFSINVNDPNGRLSSVGTVSNTASGASGIAITPDNAFAYVTPGLSNDAIRGYSIGIDGTLTPTAQGSLPVTDGLTSPVIHPDGNFLFVGGRTDVKTYSIDKTTGALSFSSSMEPDTGSLIEGIALSSDGSRLFIADDTFPATPQVRSASVNASTGALTLVDSLAVSNTPRRPAVHPSLGVIYSAITAASEVAVINVSAAGNLTDSGNPLATSAEPGLSAVSPDGKFFYYVRGTFGSSTVNSASINQASGLLTAVDSETLSSEGSDVIVRPDGEYIYVTDQGGGLLQIYSVNQTTGALTPRGSETLTSGVSGMGTTN